MPAEALVWQWLERTAYDVLRRYGFEEVRLPILESADLFARGIGQETDVVGKEMYTFNDKGDPPELLAMRPELTASAVRAYVQHSVAQTHPLVKWYYSGPAFRYEQPQAGRMRQFHTVGIELIGSAHPEADAEAIACGIDILEALGIKNYRLRLNSLGQPAERAAYRHQLVGYLRAHLEGLSPESQRRTELNPLRVLDSKDERDQDIIAEAPKITDTLGTESLEHFARVKDLLEEYAIEFVTDHRLVRGLDYYTRTAFEFQGLDLGAQDALGGGGRYDGLVEQVGGKPTPAVGFGLGLERLMMAAQAAGTAPAPEPALDVYIAALDDPSRVWAAGALRGLRRAGMSAEYDLGRRSLKAQMREANRKGARLAVIIGEEELKNRRAQLKDLKEGTQTEVQFDELHAVIGQRVK